MQKLLWKISKNMCVALVIYILTHERCVHTDYAYGVVCVDTLLTLQWRHNGRDSVSNHQPHDCLLNGLIRRRSKKTSKHHWPLCEEFIGDWWIPTQMASNAENVAIWWRHHDLVRISRPNQYTCTTHPLFIASVLNKYESSCHVIMSWHGNAFRINNPLWG